MSITSAMILAAGRGERLRPLTDKVPKPLIEIASKRLIEYHIENLVRADIKDIVINTSWLGEQIHHVLGDGSNYGASIRYSDEAEALETAGGIIKALPLLDDTFLVINGDIWTDFDFTTWRDIHLASQAHLLLVNNPEHNPEGDFSLEHGLLMNAGASMYTYSGIGIYTAEFFAGLAQGIRPLAPIIRHKSDEGLISAELFKGRWLDMGTLQRLQQLEQLLDDNA